MVGVGVGVGEVQGGGGELVAGLEGERVCGYFVHLLPVRMKGDGEGWVGRAGN